MRSDLIVVLTGAIGSGKSYIAQCFVSAGWAYIDADTIGHEILKQAEVVAEVARLWPHTVKGGAIDRALLGDTAFSDPHALVRLEGITHPRIRYGIDQWLAATNGPRIVEVSVLKVVDTSWGVQLVVDAPLSVRLERLKARGMSADTAAGRIRAQPLRPKWLQAADIVIDNSRQQQLELGRLLEMLVR